MIYCSSCGESVNEGAKFCRKCGSKVVGKATGVDLAEMSDSQIESRITDEEKTKLKKSFIDTGNTSVALCIVGFILSVVISLADSSTPTSDTIVGAIILSPLYFPFYYFGKKLKDINVQNIQYSLKVTQRMFIYSLVFIAINVALGGGVGWLWLALTYSFNKASRETVNALK